MDSTWHDAWTGSDETRQPLMIIRHPPESDRDPPGEHERPYTDRRGLLAIVYPSEDERDD
jgi:hypothetical protein